MSGLFFNDGVGVTHSLELCLFDGVGVWRGIVDGFDVFFFDAGTDVFDVSVFGLAVDLWLCGGVWDV